VIYVFGRGRVGKFLSVSWRNAGLDVSLRASKMLTRTTFAPRDVVVLAVPDPGLALAATQLAERLAANMVVLHCAGRLSESVLGACSARAACGVLHPLSSVIPSTPPLSRASAVVRALPPTFVVSGAPRAVREAERLVRAVGARVVSAPVHGARYHAAASLVAAGQLALFREAAAIFESVGMSSAAAKRAVLGLAASVADNADRDSFDAALTGSVVRGDVGAVRMHRDALAKSAEALGLYDAVARSLLPVAKARGVETRTLRALEEALRESLSETQTSTRPHPAPKAPKASRKREH
jgi:predicted short-subunit dehydrogenase-like oxidoreductase (DUF2520 family)